MLPHVDKTGPEQQKKKPEQFPSLLRLNHNSRGQGVAVSITSTDGLLLLPDGEVQGPSSTIRTSFSAPLEPPGVGPPASV